MRSVDTPVKKIRREVFTEICKVAFESTKENFNDEIEAIPYRIVQERAVYRDSIYRERAVASERVRLAMGMSLRPEDKAVHITAGMENSNIDQKTADKEDQQRKTDLHTEGDQIGNMFIPEGDPAVGFCHYLLRDFRGDLRRVQIGRSEEIVIHGRFLSSAGPETCLEKFSRHLLWKDQPM